VKRT